VPQRVCPRSRKFGIEDGTTRPTVEGGASKQTVLTLSTLISAIGCCGAKVEAKFLW
jgi:hypothetical protein